jgi:hypothetical protein
MKLRAAVLTGWLIAGTADIVAATVYYPLTAPVTALRILQGIAAGVLGRAAFTGGFATAALGLACHYVIALIWTVVFFAVYPRIALLARSRVVTAVLYGTFVSAAMSFVVLPLSRVAPRPFNAKAFAIATVILVFSIGTPLVIVASRYYGRGARRS